MKFIPYGKQSIDEDDIQSVVNILKSDFITTGPKVKEFEENLASYVEAKYCVSVSNGTAALHLASLILLKEGDKVLTTVNSFLATSNSILYTGAKPIFIDIKDDGNINLDLCEEELRKDSSIKAIYAVHFSGNQVNQEKLRYLKETYKIKVLEDCAHALGSKQGLIKAGSCKNSDFSIFSFHPVKHLTTGEGGAITTNCEKLYKKLIRLRNHGMEANYDIAPWHYDMTELGFNYRLTDIASALGLSQLKKLDGFIEKRKSLAKKYNEYFENINGIESLYEYSEESSYHLFVVKIDFNSFGITKKDFVLQMREKDIGLQYHYIPINKQPYYKSLGYGNEVTPVMDEYYDKAISLPLYPKLTFDEQSYVIKSIKEVLNV